MGFVACIQKNVITYNDYRQFEPFSRSQLARSRELLEQICRPDMKRRERHKHIQDSRYNKNMIKLVYDTNRETFEKCRKSAHLAKKDKSVK